MKFILPDLKNVAKIKIFYATSNLKSRNTPIFRQHKRFQYFLVLPSLEKAAEFQTQINCTGRKRAINITRIAVYS
jgi:hypothetical protein